MCTTHVSTICEKQGSVAKYTTHRRENEFGNPEESTGVSQAIFLSALILVFWFAPAPSCHPSAAGLHSRRAKGPHLPPVAPKRPLSGASEEPARSPKMEQVGAKGAQSEGGLKIAAQQGGQTASASKNQGIAELSFDHRRGNSMNTTSNVVGSATSLYAQPAIARPAPMYRIATKSGYRRKWRVLKIYPYSPNATSLRREIHP